MESHSRYGSAASESPDAFLAVVGVRRTSTATAPAPALSSSRSPLHLSYNPMIFRQDVLVEARALAVLILVVVVSVRVSQNREKTVHLRC